MQAGKLRHRLTIQAPQSAIDDDGGVTTTWQTVATVWGSVSPLTMREHERAAAIDARITHRIVMRGRTVSPSARFVFQERLLYPSSVLNADERGIMLEILAIESVPAPE